MDFHKMVSQSKYDFYNMDFHKMVSQSKYDFYNMDFHKMVSQSKYDFYNMDFHKMGFLNQRADPPPGKAKWGFSIKEQIRPLEKQNGVSQSKSGSTPWKSKMGFLNQKAVQPPLKAQVGNQIIFSDLMVSPP